MSLKEYDAFVLSIDKLFSAGDAGVIKGVQKVEAQCLLMGIHLFKADGKKLNLMEQFRKLKEAYVNKDERQN